MKFGEGQQKIKIVRTNRQSNLRCSCQSIFSLSWHHPKNILLSGPVTVNSGAVIQIQAGNSVFGAVIQLPPRFIFGREREILTRGRVRGNYELRAVIRFLPRNNENALVQFVCSPVFANFRLPFRNCPPITAFLLAEKMKFPVGIGSGHFSFFLS